MPGVFRSAKKKASFERNWFGQGEIDWRIETNIRVILHSHKSAKSSRRGRRRNAFDDSFQCQATICRSQKSNSPADLLGKSLKGTFAPTFGDDGQSAPKARKR